MKNTKKYRKINKSTRRHKGGIRRNNVSQFITQTAGYNSIFNDSQTGGQAGGPSPATATLNIYQLESSSLRESLQSYGDAIQSIIDAAQTGVDIYQLPTGAPTTTNPNTPSYNEMVIQYNSAKDVRDAAVTLMNTFSGPTGLYKTIYGDSAVFIPTPSPAPAVSGGMFGGQAGAPSAATLAPRSGLTQTLLQTKLQEFGNALMNLSYIAYNYNTMYNTTQPLNDVSPSGTTEYTAYSAFRSQQVASESILEAIESTVTSFSGTDDFNASTGTGSRGLYRAILGDSFRFTPPSPPPGVGIAVARIASSSTPASA
jgi:hypothetical protein